MKQTWQQKVEYINTYHVAKLKEADSLTVSQTANHFGYSIGSVSQFLRLASWMKTHGNHLEKIKSLVKALDWIKNKERERKIS